MVFLLLSFLVIFMLSLIVYVDFFKLVIIGVDLSEE